MAIYFYKEFGELGYLASYSNHGFYKNDIFYKTVEHYYQSEKMKDINNKIAIINSKTPKEASLLGRNPINLKKDNWRNIKNKVMYEATLLKFEQNKDIKQKLIETKNQTIYEETVDEYYWGCGKDHSGKNVYGKVLMRVRNKLKRDIINSILRTSKNREVYVIGHKHPDIDSIFSSALLTNILKSYNINAHFGILSEDYKYLDDERYNKFLKERPEIITDLDNKYYILINHNDLEQSIGIKYQDKVIGAFDHHIYTGKVDNTLRIDYISTGLLIYDMFRKKYVFSDEEKRYIGFSAITSLNDLSSRYDKRLFSSLKLNHILTNTKKEGKL